MKGKAVICVTLFVMCIFSACYSARTYASDGGEDERLTVNAVWIDGDMLRIDVTDKQTAVNSALSIRITDYIKEADDSEYISIQAVDLDGNKSGIIQLKNPYYQPKDSNLDDSEKTEEESQPPTQEPNDSEQAEGAFTPDGVGTVIDNVVDGSGKEFFTITTEENNVFYLIVDRKRESENVYLLNAVTEDDLLALSKKNGNSTSESGVSAIPTPEPTPTPTPEPSPETEPTPTSGSNVGTIIFIFVAVLAVGAAGFYFKIYLPRKDEMDDNDEDVDYEDEQEEYANKSEVENEAGYDGDYDERDYEYDDEYGDELNSRDKGDDI